jgi:hypothetical protein
VRIAADIRYRKTLVPKEKLGLERGRYVSAQWVDTSKLLGPIAFDYVARIKIPALGERRIPVRGTRALTPLSPSSLSVLSVSPCLNSIDVKSVGYGIGIEPEATLEVTGRQIPEVCRLVSMTNRLIAIDHIRARPSRRGLASSSL